ncbi:MAG: glycoside hydrolase family 3 N-terminal domain-containing protein, partial [Anaerolineae bacterium]|nr:glycoside hydrolase family 3 N-terminal domain-containing protein [Anaerolineae bacterium]
MYKNAALPHTFYNAKERQLKHARMKRFWQIWLAAILLLLLETPVHGGRQTAATAQEEQPAPQAQTLLNQMTPEERVGQLFLVPFIGDSAANDSDIAMLIRDYHVGGVVLLTENNNITGFGDPDGVPLQINQLTNDLQRLALTGESTVASTLPEDELIDPDAVPPTAEATPVAPNVPIPLLTAVNHEGDGPPHSAIFNGLTPIPNNMALGATWHPRHAEAIGDIVGRELAAVGVNMLLGPALDVLENPTPFSSSDMGVRTFGGDPYWVGLMGEAYTSGVHLGSDNRVAVVAKHFPGNGSSDRPVNQEVPTVRKSLEQLKQIELAPFFAVTGQAKSPTSTVDALLTTHIRYQGFQGNIRATTAPVSFDPQALTTLMGLPQFAGWRQDGGLIVSDALGARSVERFYDDTEQEFPHRQVAKDAFLAGNDLLYLRDFALGDADYAAQLANIQDTILWFRERYDTDISFQQRVDDAVLRILQLKLRLYGRDFSPENVIVANERVGEIVGKGDAAVFEVAQSAITLISPSPSELLERLASPPGVDDQIVIFTDVRTAQQCAICPPQSLIGLNDLEAHILGLYGPEASAQVQPEQISSFSFTELRNSVLSFDWKETSPSLAA